MPTTAFTLPTVADQARRLIDLGVHDIARIPARTFSDVAERAGTAPALLAVHPTLVPASALAPLVKVNGKPGFVVVDMTDVDDFDAVAAAPLPDAPVYLVLEPDRGDEMANWSPDEALPAITDAGRTPLTLTEGLHWLLQRPETLERNHCFMTIGSRRTKPDGKLDSRTPALWISNGGGRDGKLNKDAPKVGWCWAGNRHTWLGFASAASRFDPLA